MTPEALAALALGLSLLAYVLTGGADFGGGVWDLLASGPRRQEQRKAIESAIGPIWEANHVWLIVAVVITFVAFPAAFAAISIALHLPLTLMLIGIVFRGTAFVFRAYDAQDDHIHRRWSLVFAVSSVATPVFLGVVVGSVASGRIRLQEGRVAPDWVGAWLAPFPWAVGLLTLAIFAFLAAVYLTLDTADDPPLQEDFRLRGLWAAGAVFVLAWVSFFLARTGAPVIWEGLWASPWAWPFQGVVAVVGLACIGALWTRRYLLARNLAAAEAVLVVGGWAFAQFPYVVVPDITIEHAAPPAVLWMMLTALAVGALPLALAYGWMIRVFKGPARG